MTSNIVQHLFFMGISLVFILATSTTLVAQQEGNVISDKIVLTAANDNCTLGTYHYQATDFIQATNQIAASVKADYQAGNFIQLKSGFQAKAGSTFRAYIETPNNNQQNETATALNLNAPYSTAIHPVSLKNYPNPFAQQTTIEYKLLETATVSLSIYNMLGQLQQTLITNENTTAGTYRVTFDRGNLAAGTYLYQLMVNDRVMTKKLMIN